MSTLTPFIETEAGQLANAVVDILNDGTIALPAPAQRFYLPSIELSSPLDTSILVAATGRRQMRETRGGAKEHTPGVRPSSDPLLRYVLVEIGINKKFGAYSDVQAADPMAKLCEDVADLLASIRINISSTKVAFPQPDGTTPAVQQDPYYDPAIWKENNQFTGIIKINYRVLSL